MKFSVRHRSLLAALVTSFSLQAGAPTAVVADDSIDSLMNSCMYYATTVTCREEWHYGQTGPDGQLYDVQLILCRCDNSGNEWLESSFMYVHGNVPSNPPSAPPPHTEVYSPFDLSFQG